MAVSETTQNIKQIVLNELEDVHTMFIAKIISLDNEKRVASVELLQKLVKTTRGTSIQTVTGQKDEVPIMPIFDSLEFSIWAPYKKDDKVIIQISERPLYEALISNEISEQQQTGRMQIGYCLVMKPIPHDLLTGTQKSSDSLFIEHKSTGNFFKFSSDGSIEISANVKINGSLEVSEKGTFGGLLESNEDVKSNSISLINHLHGNVQSGNSKTSVPE